MTWLNKITNQINRIFSQELAEDSTEAEVVDFLEKVPDIGTVKENQTALESLQTEFETFKETAVSEEAVQELIKNAVESSAKEISKSMATRMEGLKKEVSTEIAKKKSQKSIEAKDKGTENTPGVKQDGLDEENSREVSSADLFKPGSVVPGLL